ncbi:twitching motility protein PilT [Clostridia bacterium]|nr:twitching motility protein PilT [Clostridia bacterium]
MIILLDTNIIVDIISRRDGYSESLQVMRYCETGAAKGFITAKTVTDLMYILRKHIEPDSVREAVQTLLAILDVTDVLKSDITNAFKSEMKDYEDAVQASCAARIKADYIVTRNFKDFIKSPVPPIRPGDMAELLQAR